MLKSFHLGIWIFLQSLKLLLELFLSKMFLKLLNQILTFVAQLSDFQLFCLVLSTQNFHCSSWFSPKKRWRPHFFIVFTSWIQQFTRWLTLRNVEGTGRFCTLELLAAGNGTLKFAIILSFDITLLFVLISQSWLLLYILFLNFIFIISVNLLNLSLIKSINLF